MNKVNSLVICKDKYDSQEEFENAIRDAIMVLLNNDYVMTVKYDEKGLGVVAIEYDYNDPMIVNTYPYWLTNEEYERTFWNCEDKE